MTTDMGIRMYMHTKGSDTSQNLVQHFLISIISKLQKSNKFTIAYHVIVVLISDLQSLMLTGVYDEISMCVKPLGVD